MENFESTPKPEGAPECTVYYTPELVSKAIAELTAESARSAIEERTRRERKRARVVRVRARVMGFERDFSQQKKSGCVFVKKS